MDPEPLTRGTALHAGLVLELAVFVIVAWWEASLGDRRAGMRLCASTHAVISSRAQSCSQTHTHTHTHTLTRWLPTHPASLSSHICLLYASLSSHISVCVGVCACVCVCMEREGMGSS